MFKRNTRIKTVLCEDDIEILDPPAKPKKPKNNLLMSLLPSVGMLLAAGIMAYIGGATMLIFSGISTIMAIITSVLGMLQGKQEYEKDIEDRSLKYNAYIDNKCKDIERLRNEEARQLERIYIGCEENRYHFEVFSSDLFDREVGDEDFLHVSLGRGDVEAMQKIKYKKQEKLEIEDELQTLPEKICAEYRQIHNAPIVCDFHKSSAVGVMGMKISDTISSKAPFLTYAPGSFIRMSSSSLLWTARIKQLQTNSACFRMSIRSFQITGTLPVMRKVKSWYLNLFIMN